MSPRAVFLPLALALLSALPTQAHAKTPRPLRQHHSIIEYLDFQDDSTQATRTSPSARRNRPPKPPPLECLGRSVHPPWQNPFSPLPGRLAERHQRITVSPGPAAVEYGDALLVSPGERLRFQLIPRHDARLELAYRVYRCGPSTPLALKVTVTDALGAVTTTHALTTRQPRPVSDPASDAAPASNQEARLRDSGFTDLVVELPVAADTPFLLELEVVARDDTTAPERRPRRDPPAPGGLVALIDPTLSGYDLDASNADTNVLWIVIDAVRHDAMGPGRQFAPSASPELDRRVFSRGTAFTNAYALANQTRTSTVAMLASVPASIGGFHSHSWSFTSGKRETFYQRNPDLVTRVLARHGFLTKHIGHNHFIWGSEVIGIDHGFQRALDIRAIPQDAIQATHAATRFFEQHRDSRWMLMLNYTAPHTPYRPPEAFLEKAHALTNPPSTERIGWLPRTYLGEILWVDHNLEQVFAALERLDLLEDTLVIVTADHGEVMNPAHDCSSALLSQPCGFNHGVTVYDDELRVPLAFALPRRITPGGVVTTPISHADLGPTILDVLGLPPARRHIGRSLFPALSGGHIPAEAIYADGRLAAAFVLNDLKLIIHAAQDDIRPRPRMIDGEPSRHELFDLLVDPHESTNLAKTHKHLIPMVTAELDRARQHMRRVFETGAPRHSPPPETTVAGARTTHHLMLSAPKRAVALVTVKSSGPLLCGPSYCRQVDTHELALTLEGDRVFATFTARDGDRLTVHGTLDTERWPTERFRLGPWGLAMLRPGESLDGERLSWLDTTAPPTPQPAEAALYLYRDPPAAPRKDELLVEGEGGVPGISPEDLAPDLDGDAALGGEVKRILKDLGYTR